MHFPIAPLMRKFMYSNRLSLLLRGVWQSLIICDNHFMAWNNLSSLIWEAWLCYSRVRSLSFSEGSLGFLLHPSGKTSTLSSLHGRYYDYRRWYPVDYWLNIILITEVPDQRSMVIIVLFGDWGARSMEISLSQWKYVLNILSDAYVCSDTKLLIYRWIQTWSYSW